MKFSDFCQKNQRKYLNIFLLKNQNKRILKIKINLSM